VTVIWDVWLRQQIGKFKARRAREKDGEDVGAAESNAVESIPIGERSRERATEGLQRRGQPQGFLELTASERTDAGMMSTATGSADDLQVAPAPLEHTDMNTHAISVKVGIAIIVVFLGMCKFRSSKQG
jgi:hypothetical protein